MVSKELITKENGKDYCVKNISASLAVNAELSIIQSVSALFVNQLTHPTGDRRRDEMSNQVDDQVLLLSLKSVLTALDNLLSDCIDDNGNLKQPSKQSIMKAKGYLPAKYRNAYNR